MRPSRHQGSSVAGPALIGAGGSLAFLAWAAVTIVLSIQYDRSIGGHLELAANANQPDTAIEELKLALQGMDGDGLTCNKPRQCYTSVMYTEPDEDLGFWRMNIEQTLGDLEALPPDADHLKVSNTLLKVRDSLTGQGESGTHIIDPSGVSRYPHNAIMGWWGWLSAILIVTGFGLAFKRAT